MQLVPFYMRSIKWAIQLPSERKGFWLWAPLAPRSTKYQNPVEKNHTHICHLAFSLLVYFSMRSKSLRALFLSPPAGFEWEVAVKPLSQPAQSLFLQHSRTSKCGVCVSFLPTASTTVPGRGTLLNSTVCHAARLLHSCSTSHIPMWCPHLILIITIPVHPCPAQTRQHSTHSEED